MGLGATSRTMESGCTRLKAGIEGLCLEEPRDGCCGRSISDDYWVRVEFARGCE